jgi:predicted O-methyltransferase YrrM
LADVDEVRGRIQRWDEAAWCLAALVLSLADGRDDEQVEAARQVMQAVGVPPTIGQLSDQQRHQLAAQATAPLVQIAALLTGERGWIEHRDEALIAQGRASAQAAVPFKQAILPQLTGLGARFDTPGCRMLDVGTGVAAMAVAYAETFPDLTVVGIDVLPRALSLARQTVAGSAAGTRVELRQQDIAALPDVDAYDLIWIPAPFVPEAALRAGLGRAAHALRRDGWIMLGHGRFDGDVLQDALTAFKTRAYGGTPLDAAAAQRLLTDNDLVDVATLTTPPGGPALTVGRLGR